MGSRRIVLFLAGIGAGLSIGLPAALADAIDGNWCATDGKHMTIDGSNFVSPGGTKMTGDYDRHAFHYVVPAGEPGAGASIRMILVDDNTVQSWTEEQATKTDPEMWKRCEVTA